MEQLTSSDLEDSDSDTRYALNTTSTPLSSHGDSARNPNMARRQRNNTDDQSRRGNTDDVQQDLPSPLGHLHRTPRGEDAPSSTELRASRHRRTSRLLAPDAVDGHEVVDETH